jgi:hypothetical protein
MKQIEVHFWYLPPPPWTPRAKPHLSRWKMTAEEAQRRGTLGPDPASRELLDVAETPEEEAELRRRTDTSVLGGPAPGSISDRRGKA